MADLTRELTIVAFSGSLRAASYNTALLREAASLLPAGVTLTLESYRDLPLFDPDLGEVAAVEALKSKVRGADGVLIATPEYNYGVPGPLKNMLDWLSRPGYRSVFAQKPVGVLSAAPSVVGGARAQVQLKGTLDALVAQVFPYPDVAIGQIDQRIDAGHITSDATREVVREYLVAFAAWVAGARQATAR